MIFQCGDSRPIAKLLAPTCVYVPRLHRVGGQATRGCAPDQLQPQFQKFGRWLLMATQGMVELRSAKGSFGDGLGKYSGHPGFGHDVLAGVVSPPI